MALIQFLTNESTPGVNAGQSERCSERQYHRGGLPSRRSATVKSPNTENFGLAPMAYFELVFCILAVAVSIYVQERCRYHRTRKTSGASTVPGFPLLGNTISLATQGARFLHDCKRLVRHSTFQHAHDYRQHLVIPVTPMQHGDVFKLKLAGQQMTYLLHPDSIKLFFTAPDDQIAFRRAV